MGTNCSVAYRHIMKELMNNRLSGLQKLDENLDFEVPFASSLKLPTD
jgi:hypothetical protein